MNDISSRILRFSMAGIFLWFGIQQLTDPSSWVFFLPEWMGYIPVPGAMIVQINGLFEIVSAALLVMGVFVRPLAVILGVHLLGIAITTMGAIGVRDAGLAAAMFALAASAPGVRKAT